jgi:hypothetical protein
LVPKTVDFWVSIGETRVLYWLSGNFARHAKIQDQLSALDRFQLGIVSALLVHSLARKAGHDICRDDEGFAVGTLLRHNSRSHFLLILLRTARCCYRLGVAGFSYCLLAKEEKGQPCRLTNRCRQGRWRWQFRIYAAFSRILRRLKAVLQALCRLFGGVWPKSPERGSAIRSNSKPSVLLEFSQLARKPAYFFAPFLIWATRPS